MTVRRTTRDPRGGDERTADEEILRRFESGAVLDVDRVAERQAMEHIQRRTRSRRELVATLGKELGVLRRAHGLTQEQVARAIGTNKSNVSRLESGRYGGLTVERFIAVLEAFQALGRAEVGSRRIRRVRAVPRVVVRPAADRPRAPRTTRSQG